MRNKTTAMPTNEPCDTKLAAESDNAFAAMDPTALDPRAPKITLPYLPKLNDSLDSMLEVWVAICRCGNSCDWDGWLEMYIPCW
jgi:hypothetical protein